MGATLCDDRERYPLPKFLADLLVENLCPSIIVTEVKVDAFSPKLEAGVIAIVSYAAPAFLAKYPAFPRDTAAALGLFPLDGGHVVWRD
jgi:hypothetical protein